MGKSIVDYLGNRIYEHKLYIMFLGKMYLIENAGPKYLFKEISCLFMWPILLMGSRALQPPGKSTRSLSTVQARFYPAVCTFSLFSSRVGRKQHGASDMFWWVKHWPMEGRKFRK